MKAYFLQRMIAYFIDVLINMNLFKVYVYEFSLGMGPKLLHYKKKKGETEYYCHSEGYDLHTVYRNFLYFYKRLCYAVFVVTMRFDYLIFFYFFWRYLQ